MTIPHVPRFGRDRAGRSPGAAVIGTRRAAIQRLVLSSWLFIVVNAVLSVGILPTVIRHVDLETYGWWSAIASVFTIAALGEAGISAEVGRRVAQAYGEQDRAALRHAVELGTSAVAAVFVVIFIILVSVAHPVVSFLAPHAPAAERGKLTVVFIAAAFLFCSTNVLNAYLATLNGLQRTDYANNGAVVGSVLAACGTLGAAVLGWGIWALLFGSALQTLAVGFLGARGVRLVAPDLGWPFRRTSIREASSFLGAPVLLLFVQLSNIFDFQFDKLVLSHYRGPEAVAFFQIGTIVALQLRLLAMTPASVLTSGTAELFARERARLERVLHSMSTSTYAIGGLTLGGGIVLGQPFVRIWMGAGYGQAGLATQLLSVSLLVNTLAAPWFFYLIGRGRRGLLARSAVANMLANVVCTLTLTPRLGLEGALAGSLIGNCLGVALLYFGIRRDREVDWLRYLARPAAVIVPAVGVGSIVTNALAPTTWPSLLLAAALWVILVGAALVLARAVAFETLLVGAAGRRAA